MPLILWIPESLALENMSQMASTVIAHNLGSHHAQARVGFLAYSSWHGVPEGRPSAARVELVVCFVERRVATGAAVDAGGRVVLIVFAGAGHLGALLPEDAELFCSQLSAYAPSS